MMTNGDKMAGFNVIDETNRHRVASEEQTKAFPVDVAMAQKGRNTARTDALMRILQ